MRERVGRGRAIDYIGGGGRGGGPRAAIAPRRGPPAAAVLLLLHALTLGWEPGLLHSHLSNGDVGPWHARARFRPALVPSRRTH